MVQGNFENSKNILVNFKSDIIKNFKIKKELIDANNPYILTKSKIQILYLLYKKNRFSDQPFQKIKNKNKKKSNSFTERYY